MPRDLFHDDPSLKLGAQKWYTVPLSIFVHVLILGTFIVIPLMATDVLPTPPGMMSFVATAPTPPPPPPPPPQRSDVPPPSPETANPDAAPIEAPSTIEPETKFTTAPADRHIVDGLGTDFIGKSIEPPPPPQRIEPVRIGGQIKAPLKLKNVEPIYPSIAQAAKVEGMVIIEATIGVDGRVQDAKVLRSIPLLDTAAVDAVRQWQYTPTLLNGVPVPIVMTVTVRFQLR